MRQHRVRRERERGSVKRKRLSREPGNRRLPRAVDAQGAARNRRRAREIPDDERQGRRRPAKIERGPHRKCRRLRDRTEPTHLPPVRLLSVKIADVPHEQNGITGIVYRRVIAGLKLHAKRIVGVWLLRSIPPGKAEVRRTPVGADDIEVLVFRLRPVGAAVPVPHKQHELMQSRRKRDRRAPDKVG